MNILLVGAMTSEIDYFVNNLQLKEKQEKCGFMFYICEYKDKTIYLVESGIGRTMAGLLIGVAVANYNIDKVINIGIAGGSYPITLKDIVACDKYIYGDVDVTFFNYEFGQMAQCPKVFNADPQMLEIAINNGGTKGTICTCDSFTSSKETVDEIKHKLKDVNNIVAFDMESCSFAQACYFMKLPFLAIRSISDVIGDSNQKEEYLNNEEKPEIKANELVLTIINNL